MKYIEKINGGLIPETVNAKGRLQYRAAQPYFSWNPQIKNKAKQNESIELEDVSEFVERSLIYKGNLPRALSSVRKHRNYYKFGARFVL